MATTTECRNLFPYSAGYDHLVHVHKDEFERLNRAIRSGGGFRLLLSQYNLPYYRDLLLDRLKNLEEKCHTLDIDRENFQSFDALQHHLAELTKTTNVLHLIGLGEWPAVPAEEWLSSLNLRRETIASQCQIPLVFWLPGRLIKELALQAPDMWAWRAGVFDFSVRSEVTVPLFMAGDHKFLTAPECERRRNRIEELATYIRSHPNLTPSLRASLLREWGDLHRSLGEPEKAMELFREALALYRFTNDEMNIAETWGHIAYIHQFRGELDEALRIHLEKSLPIYEQLGHERECAITKSYIADIHKVKGELKKALQIFNEVVLPSFDRIGDTTGHATTMGKIADIYKDEGWSDEALKIYEKEVLPTFDQRGDVRGAAIIKGKIADIYQSRGELDEALRIRREEELPVYERLGELRELLITRAKVGIALLQLRPTQNKDASNLLCQALADARRMNIAEADQIQSIILNNGISCEDNDGSVLKNP